MALIMQQHFLNLKNLKKILWGYFAIKGMNYINYLSCFSLQIISTPLLIFGNGPPHDSWQKVEQHPLSLQSLKIGYLVAQPFFQLEWKHVTQAWPIRCRFAWMINDSSKQKEWRCHFGVMSCSCSNKIKFQGASVTVVQEWHQVSKVGIRFLGDSLPGVTLAMILAAVSRLSFLSFSMSVPPPPGFLEIQEIFVVIQECSIRFK